MELTAAEPRRKGLVQLYIDGEAAVKVDREVFLLSRLKPGDELTDEELHQLILDSDARRATEKALYLLEYRDHSKRELMEKIARTAASREAAEAAAEKMEELGLVDDESYARRYARELFERKRFGPMRVRQELRQKGIRPELADELLAEYDDPDAFAERIGEILARKYPGWQEDERVKRRAFAALQRMGYSYEHIREGMREASDRSSWS